MNVQCYKCQLINNNMAIRKGGEYLLLVGFSLVDRAENSSKSPLFASEIGANGSFGCALGA